MKKNNSILFVASAAIIAALYVVLTLVCYTFSYMDIQCRLSEALTILPVFMPAAIPGLAVGCLISNAFSTVGPMDMLFGTAATLLAAVLTALTRKLTIKKYPLLSFLMPVLANGFIVAAELKLIAGLETGYWILFASVAIGEAIAVFVVGSVLWKVFDSLARRNQLIRKLCYKDLRIAFAPKSEDKPD